VRADGVGECAGWVGLFGQQMFSIGEREREIEIEIETFASGEKIASGLNIVELLGACVWVLIGTFSDS